MELELDDDESGVAGAVAVESVPGALGEVDCCFEQAETTASALMHNNSKLRFIDHLAVSRPGPAG